MIPLRANQALVAEEILLDGRLALFHKSEGWLAVADLHFGYEISQRAAGRLVPMWGMASISERLFQLLGGISPGPADYSGRPRARSKRRGGSGPALATSRRALRNDCGGRKSRPAGSPENRNGGIVGNRALLLSSRALRGELDGTHSDHRAPSSGRRYRGRRRPAAEMSGVRAAIELLDHAGIFPLGERRSLGPDEASRVWLCTANRVFALPDRQVA